MKPGSILSLLSHIAKAFIKAYRDGVWRQAEKIERSDIHPAEKWRKLRAMGVCRYCVQARIGTLNKEYALRQLQGIQRYPHDYKCKGCNERTRTLGARTNIPSPHRRRLPRATPA